MKFLIQIISIFIICAANVSYGQWINEIHYDNIGGDVNECIEIAGPAGTDMSSYSIVLYNGATPYDTDALSGIIPDEGCGYGAISICYPANGIQNGGADGIVLYDGSSVVQFLSYEGVINATSGVANGMTSTDIGVQESNGTTASTESLQLTGSGSNYLDYTWQSPAASSMGSLNAGQSITPCVAPNTITTGAITGAPFTVDCSVPTTDNGTVAFTTVGTFNVGNTFTVEMSDASGSFASPTIVGTLTGAPAEGVDPSGTINITIPSTAESGAGYLFRIVSDTPIATGSSSIAFSITQNGACTPPWITSVIINSCNGMCTEGYNEIVFGNSGDYSFDVNTTDFNFTYGSNAPPTANTEYTDILENNATTLAALNAAAGCPGLFIDAAGTTIPAGASWMLAYTDICDEALTWSGLCGSGPIYVIFQDDSDWQLGGNFANNPGGLRYFQTSITSTSGDTYTIDYSIDGSQYGNSDGAFATFLPAGGPADTYGDDNCTLTPVVLPVELTKFEGSIVDKMQNLLQWQTVSEYNSSYFTVERSMDAEDWSFVGNQMAAQNSQEVINYQLIDDRFVNEINYYRLLQYDLNGEINIHPHYVVIDNRLDKNSNLVGIFNLLGQEVDENYFGLQIHLFEDGSSIKIYR